MTMPLLRALIPALLVSTVAAQTYTYDVTLAGDEEVPPVVTTGSGAATVTLDTSSGAVTVSGTYSSMSSAVVAAHVHGPARRGDTAGVLVGLTTTGGTDGTFRGSGTLSSSDMQSMLDGLTYLNVHTVNEGGGEIRAQIDTVPGSGSPGAAPVEVSGAATGGSVLAITCPPATNPVTTLVGVPLPVGSTTPLPASIACMPGPVELGVDVSVPPIILPSGSISLAVPAPIVTAEVAIQCVFLRLTPCVDASAAVRVAIRP